MSAPKPPAAKVKQVTAGDIVEAVLSELLKHEVRPHFDSDEALDEAFPNGIQVEPYKLRSKIEGYAARALERAHEEGINTEFVHIRLVEGLTDSSVYQAWREEFLADVASGKYSFNKEIRSRARIQRRAGARA